MNSLEKYAAKAKITKEMIERLSSLIYGKKPVAGKTFRRAGAAIGGVGGAGLGGVSGILASGLGSLSAGSGSLASILEKSIPAAGLGGAGLGAAYFGKGLHRTGKSIDELLIRKQMAKYLKRKKATNIGLGAGGGLAALLAVSKKD